MASPTHSSGRHTPAGSLPLSIATARFMALEQMAADAADAPQGGVRHTWRLIDVFTGRGEYTPKKGWHLSTKAAESFDSEL